jgi:hypothetical protein
MGITSREDTKPVRLARGRRVYRCSSRHPRLGDFLSMMEEARGITANRIRFDQLLQGTMMGRVWNIDPIGSLKSMGSN